MLKFFRKYNKILLVVFGTGLMVIFLIEPAMRGCGAGSASYDLGTAAGNPITAEDQRRAAMQLQVLERLGGRERLPLLIVSQTADAWQWLLMSLAARGIGLSVGSAEVNEALERVGVNDEDLGRVSRDLGVSRDFVRAAVGQWLLIDRYRGLVYGMAPISVTERIDRYNQLAPHLMRGYGDITLPLGEPYLCDRVIQYFLHSFQSTVQVSMIVLPYSENSDVIDAPTEEQVQALFEKHKGDKVGEGGPHGFGYLVPDQVKLEYLALSIETVEANITLTEREALEYHASHRDLFTKQEVASTPDVTGSASDGAEPDGIVPSAATVTDKEASTTRQLTYAEARQDVRRLARRAKAEKEADAIMRRARQILNAQIEGYELEGGYRMLPEDFTPMALQAVAETILQEHGVGLQVHGGGGAWYLESQLRELSPLADAFAAMPGGGAVPFSFYAMSVNELGAKAIPALARLGLQIGAPSQPLQSSEGRFLFRVNEVLPFAKPAFEDVQDAVVSDARKLSAYEKLVAEADAWVDQVRQFDTLEEAAEQVGQIVWSPPAFPSRVPTRAGLQVPVVEGVGRNETFVGKVFAEASQQRLAASTEGEAAPDALFAVPVPERLSLCIVRVDQYKPIPRSAYDKMAREVFPLTRAILADLGPTNPLTTGALQKRVDYQPFDAPGN